MALVSAVNTFSLKEGVRKEDFEDFSLTLDRPTCLAFDVVQSFDVYIVEGAGSSIDVIEVMTVTSWADWEAVRDHAAELKPVVDRFAQLVDEETVVTHFTRRSVASKEI